MEVITVSLFMHFIEDIINKFESCFHINVNPVKSLMERIVIIHKLRIRRK